MQKRALSRSYSLDVLKIVATVLIVFHHYQQTEGAHFGSLNFYGGRFYFGCLVELFFILSGLFMHRYVSGIRAGKAFKDFFLKRYLRLFPMMAIGAFAYEALYCVYRHFGGEAAESVYTLWGTIIAALGIHVGWAFPQYELAVNNPTWYLGVLILCYVVFFFLTYVSKRTDTSPWYYYVAMIFLGIALQTCKSTLPFLNIYNARGYICFFWGLMLAELLKRVALNRRLLLCCLAAVFVIPALFLIEPEFMKPGFIYIMTFVFFPALIILFSSDFAGRVFRFKWIGTLSQISFDVYIWHVCGFYIFDILRFVHVITCDPKARSAMIAYTICIYIFGAFSHFFIERPINRRIEKLVNRGSVG